MSENNLSWRKMHDAVLEFQYHLQNKLSIAEKALAESRERELVLVDACKTAHDAFITQVGADYNDAIHAAYLKCCSAIAKDAISAAAETVQAFRDKLTEPLRREVAMLTAIAKGLSSGTDWNGGTHAMIYRPKLLEAVDHTQATAEAYEQEVEARGAIKALEDAKIRIAARKMLRIGIPSYNTGLDDSIEEVDFAIRATTKNGTFGENLTKSKNQIDDLVNVILRNERPVS